MRGREAERDEGGAVAFAARRARQVGCVLSGAMVAAPFLALLYHPAAGLTVMALALGTLTGLAMDAARHAEPAARRRLRLVAAINALLGLACALATLVWVA